MHKLKLVSYYNNYGTEGAYDNDSEVVALADGFVYDTRYKDISRDKKVALLIEPRPFIPKAYEYVEKHSEEFKYIFTFDNTLLKLSNAKEIVYGTYWCTSDVKKTKGISMICSEKEYLEGHRKRKEIARILDATGLVDVKGKWNGGEYVQTIDALRDYKFSIAMENDKQDYYFTEKLCNCLANKVVPIYYGANKVGDFFDIKGIIYVEDRDKIPEIVKNLDVDVEYAKRKEAIDKNYELVKQYKSFDNYFYTKYAKELEEMFKK